MEEALAASDHVTEITHDHPEGIKGARVLTAAIWLALRGEGPNTVRREITTRYGYNLKQSVENIRSSHRFDVTCQGTVPTALICALESTSLEDAVRNAVSLGGDADTPAAIVGALGEALHRLPAGLVETARERYLRDEQDITGALDALYERARLERDP
ncbi:MAG: ADP-ribosylglycohydrolase family protein [Thiotrichales bacterium]|nr:ADP-ribosylglycohydrolase family protein [Thiotrichales bacterium]